MIAKCFHLQGPQKNFRDLPQHLQEAIFTSNFCREECLKPSFCREFYRSSSYHLGASCKFLAGLLALQRPFTPDVLIIERCDRIDCI